MMARVELLGLPVDALTLEETLDRAEDLIRAGGAHQHVVLNAAKVVQAQDDADLQAIIRSCDLVNADGMSVVWASRLLGEPLPERVTGIDLMDALLARAASRGFPVYFLGAREEVVRRVVEVECERHPGLEVAGYRNGYWTPDQEKEVIEAVAAACPAILLVAIPSPRKEQLLARHRETLAVPFTMGVGGSFDVVAGVTSRAPAWMQRTGLEWLHRLMLEPRRMFKRYLVGNTKFVLLVIREWRRAR
jgi:N-acetylglucosaminyldiphosphoundecaprenol N-acetyl-beta-D-mannosaminyltransferase